MATMASSPAEACPPAPLQSFIDQIYFYSTPPIVLLGIIGNLLSVVVFQCTKLRRLSTSCYLTALSISDTGFLLSWFVVWLDMVGIPAYNRAVVCELMIYLSSVCGFLSPWLIVAFTVERFVATCYPLHRAVVCTVARAKAVVVVVTLTAALSYVYLFDVAGLQSRERRADNSTSNCTAEDGSQTSAAAATTVHVCGLKSSYWDTMNILNTLDTLVTLVVPMVVIVSLNVLIARAIWHFERVRRRLTTVAAPSAAATVVTEDCNSSSVGGSDMAPAPQATVAGGNATPTMPSPTSQAMAAAVALNAGGSTATNGWNGCQGGGRRPAHRPAIRGQYQMKITKMLFVISSVFIGLNAPSYVFRLWVFFDFTAYQYRDAQQWCQLFFYLNFAINFLLYCLSGQNFRKSLCRLGRKMAADCCRLRLLRPGRLSRRSTATTMATNNSAHVWMATVVATPTTSLPPVASHSCLYSSFRGASGFSDVALSRNDSL